MIIEALTIENFKGIGEPVRIEFKPVTLLFGPNSAGKSTVIQAMHYIREILERSNFDADRTIAGGDFIDLGGFRNFVHNRETALPVRFRIDLNLASEDLPEYIEWPGHHDADRLWSVAAGIPLRPKNWNASNDVQSAWVGLTVTWSDIFQRPMLAEYETGINGNLFGKISSSEDGKRVRITRINFEHPTFPVDSSTYEGVADAPRSTIEELYDLVINETVAGKGDSLEAALEGMTSALPQWRQPLEFSASCIADPADKAGHEGFEMFVKEATALFSQLLVGPGELLRDFLCNFRYVGPLRKIPPRGYVPSKSPAENRWADGMAAWDRLYAREQGFTKKVGDWLADENKLASGYHLKMRSFRELDSDNMLSVNLASGDIMDDDFSTATFLNLEERRELQLIESRNGLAVALQDIGVGISQMIPVVVAALDEKAGLVMIEQPELHIHPKLQVNIGDLFIDQADGGPSGRIFLIETHSEHMLLRLLRRIRETTGGDLPPSVAGLKPEQLSVNYIDHDSSGLKIWQLLISREGDSLGDWPQGFFEERTGELF